MMYGGGFAPWLFPATAAGSVTRTPRGDVFQEGRRLMLGAIGLDEAHESAYRALVSVGAADVPDLARRLTLGEHDTERALRRLERHGLAAQSSSRPGRWVAAPPGSPSARSSPSGGTNWRRPNWPPRSSPRSTGPPPPNPPCTTWWRW